MRSFRVVALVGAAAFMTTPAARAADLPPIIQQAIPVADDFASGWYLRGDIGVSSQRVGRLFNVLNTQPGVVVQTVDKGFDSAGIFGLGIGYQWNSWLRLDVTGEYRSKANFHGLDIVTFPDGLGGTGIITDDYHASKHEWVFLANAYLDLGTWWSVTPFVGAGVGAAYNTISHFRDTAIGFRSDGSPIQSVAFANPSSKWNFAWALYAGLGYTVTPGLTVELAYRFIHLGDARSGDLIAFDGTNNVDNPMHFRGLESHDVKLGMRWTLDAPPPPPPPPLVTKG